MCEGVRAFVVAAAGHCFDCVTKGHSLNVYCLDSAAVTTTTATKHIYTLLLILNE